MDDYTTTAKEARKKVLQLIYEAQTSHIGSNFSCIDLLTVLFDKIDLDRDKFVLSAGWKAAALYYFLWKKGRITLEQLDSYCKSKSDFIGLAEPITKDIQIAGGSMGLGFPGAVGLALAKKLKNVEGTVYCLMSDGEQQIGTTWESALIAKQHKLNNLLVFVDFNKLQAMGEVKDILDIEPLAQKWASFGWNVFECDGHNFEAIAHAVDTGHLASPGVVIAHTIKGKGWKRAEGNNLYHYKAPSKEEYEEALAELS